MTHIAKDLRRTGSILAMALVIGLFACGLANGQTASTKPAKEIALSSANLIEATNEYKSSSKEILAIQETAVTKAETELTELRTLVAEGLVARVTLEAEEQKVAAMRAQLQTTQKQIVDSENQVAQIRADEELRKKQASVRLTSRQYGSFTTTPTMLRYDGSAGWSLGGLGTIQNFFSAKFGHSLPTSAIGQSGTHDRLGYDHRNAVDVALHPDSTEGRALISYLQTMGIPFLAFREAIPGVATGPHIHIGSPSHRLS